MELDALSEVTRMAKDSNDIGHRRHLARLYHSDIFLARCFLDSLFSVSSTTPELESAMKLCGFLSSILAVRLAAAYLVSPDGTAAPGANSDCSEWVQDSYALTCAIIEEIYGITEAQFEEWVSKPTRHSGGPQLMKRVEPDRHRDGERVHPPFWSLLLRPDQLCLRV